jgi:amino-acid N-acetyltransferase
MFLNPDISRVTALLSDCGLPHSDLRSENMGSFLALGRRDEIEGVVGLEVWASVALLRSLAVPAGQRGTGKGTRLVREAEDFARAFKVQSLFLLTTTAEHFFAGLGYRKIPRQDAPECIGSTTEFTNLCPRDAVLMTKELSC